MSSESASRVGRAQVRSKHGRWLLGLVAAMLLVAACASPTRHPSDRDRDADKYADGDGDGDDDDDDENAEDTYEPGGPATRSMGGTNRTWNIDEFTWLHVLFRNPDPSFKAPMDGYPTGYAIELTHNVILAHKTSFARASTMDGTVLMSMWKAKELKHIDPNVSRWGVEAHSYELLDSINKEFSIYKLNDSSRLPPWIAKNETASSRQLNPKVINPAVGEYRYYPYWNKDKDLAKNCYLYTFSAIDWAEVSDHLVSYGLPAALPEVGERGFRENERRYFTRWPVKLLNGCGDQLGSCLFEFDKERYVDEHFEERINARRGQLCGTWQDVGAPILCGEPDGNIFFRYNPRGHWFQRRSLLLSYVVRPIDRTTEKANCTGTIRAWRLADRAAEVWDKILFPNNCRHVKEFRVKNPRNDTFPYDITDYYWPQNRNCSGAWQLPTRFPFS